MSNLKPKILIVDDTPANLIALNALLKQLDVDVIKANSGNEALGLVLEHDFALMLLDVQMPEMDGYELAEILLDEESTQDIPIVFVTAALRDEIHRVKGYSHGAIDYIEKPINDEVLLAKVKILLKIWIKNQELSNAVEELNAVLEEMAEKNIELQTEVAERKKIQDRLDHMALYDELTDLPNRVLLKREGEKQVFAAERYGHKLGFIFLDLDGFKAVNDNHGHGTGDVALVESSLRMKNAIRDIDTVGRFGGDEFIIILPSCDSGDKLAEIAQRLIDAINEPLEAVDIKEKLGASIGIAMYPEHGKTCEELINLADKAMYKAKENGKNQFVFYS